ncbi:hypothetical protein [Neorhizobium alkalisoli]|uniref:Uncharacterized protein n=1 Tax=Neorhizobium alkalisoli TaxID=528178 RepID=A0A561R3H7_9HYPH|nr:hypothetical protein [Neorhizobium alkalisoli]TWF57178.1 hypothetical protein FHW37_102820 [Neorhizobium alkalisoli]
MDKIIAVLLEKPEFPQYLALPLMFLAALVTGLALISIAARQIFRMAVILWTLYRDNLHDDIMLALHAALDWPELSRRSLRPVSLGNALRASGLFTLAIVFFGCFLWLALAMIFSPPGAARPLVLYGIALLSMLLCVMFSRNFAITGTKHWYGIR